MPSHICAQNFTPALAAAACFWEPESGSTFQHTSSLTGRSSHTLTGTQELGETVDLRGGYFASGTRDSGAHLPATAAGRVHPQRSLQLLAPTHPTYCPPVGSSLLPAPFWSVLPIRFLRKLEGGCLREAFGGMCVFDTRFATKRQGRFAFSEQRLPSGEGHML